jgi:heme-degrading monooxygenase HmoA
VFDASLAGQRPDDRRGFNRVHWEEGRQRGDYLATQPGYVDTALHQAVGPGTEFQFVNIARWRSAEEFAAATGSPGFRESAAGLAGYRPHPGLYRIVRN